MFRSLAVVLLVCGVVAAQVNQPERKVSGAVITSARNPKVQITLPKSARYLGADRWVLFDVADCELHAFVEPDANKNVQRLYWVQFEGYIASKPTLTYDYDSPRHLSLGGMDFYVDTWVRAEGAESRAGSDREHIEAMIRAKGYKMPASMMYVRLVHLLDASRRRELMIIYGEDLAPSGYTAADLDEGGKAHAKWAELEKELIERATKAIRID